MRAVLAISRVGRRRGPIRGLIVGMRGCVLAMVMAVLRTIVIHGRVLMMTHRHANAGSHRRQGLERHEQRKTEGERSEERQTHGLILVHRVRRYDIERSSRIGHSGR